MLPKISFLYKPVLYLFAFTVFYGCQSDTSPGRTDLQLSTEPVSAVRFEKILCSPTSDSETNRSEELFEKYPIFSHVFFTQVIFPQHLRSIELDSLIDRKSTR